MYTCLCKDSIFHYPIFCFTDNDAQKLMLKVKEALEIIGRDVEILKYAQALSTVCEEGRAKYRFGRTELEVWCDEKKS